jgi:two-component system LytT family response regulator
MLRTLIIDDEADARLSTINLVNTYCSNLELVATAINVADGIAKIRELKPDLILLDIQMPDGTGFDLLKELMPIDFMVIFVTASSDHALTAIKFNALDYLLKPLSAEDFMMAVHKALLNQKEKYRNLKLTNLISEINQKEPLRLALGTSETVHFVTPSQIVRVEADANYSHFILSDNVRVMVSKPLKEYAELLENHGFFRAHQSHLINLAYLKQYDKKNGGCIMLTNKDTVPLTPRRKESLLQAYKAFKG